MTHELNTVDRARGRWREILPRLGIDTKFLVNRHGPCPLCGGRDRYRFDDKDGTGSYFCSQCGAGVGIVLVRKKHGWDFRTACEEIDKIIGDDKPAQEPAAKPRDDSEGRRRNVERLLAEAKAPNVVADYLAHRGLSVTSEALRGHARCPYYDAEFKLVGCYPAILAPVTAADGALESVQRIYRVDFEPRKKALTPVRTLSGAAVRLFPACEVLGIAEGVETALAAHEIFRIPVWAGLTENGVRTFAPPAGIKRLIVFADNDRNYVGQSAAFDLAKRMAIKAKIAAEVRIPTEPDTDWLDELNEMRVAA